MTPETILDQTAAIIRDVTRCGAVPINRTTKATDVRGWDSLSHTMILMRVEDRFGLTLSDDRTLRLSSMGELVDLIAEQLGRQPARLLRASTP